MNTPQAFSRQLIVGFDGCRDGRHPSAAEWQMLRALANELAASVAEGSIQGLAFHGFALWASRLGETSRFDVARVDDVDGEVWGATPLSAVKLHVTTRLSQHECHFQSKGRRCGFVPVTFKP